MTTELTTTTQAAIVPATYASDRNPALVYLASLTSEESRRTMRATLDKVANVVQQDAGKDGWLYSVSLA